MTSGMADLLYPQACLGCRRLTAGGICRGCLEDAPSLDKVGAICGFCGSPRPRGNHQCRDCVGRGLSFDMARQVFIFTGIIRRAVHRLKYKGESGLAEALAVPLADLVRRVGATSITWVPRSEARVRDKGFDHARLLAEAVASEIGIPAAGLIARARETPPQVDLEPEARRANLSGAFDCRLPAPDHPVVIDDVFTTGATASEAARALKEAGARTVVCLALARTVPGRLTLPADSGRTYNRDGLPPGSVVAG